MDEIESILSEITRFSFIHDEATTVAQQHPDNARALFKKGFFEASAWTRFVSKKHFSSNSSLAGTQLPLKTSNSSLANTQLPLKTSNSPLAGTQLPLKTSNLCWLTVENEEQDSPQLGFEVSRGSISFFDASAWTRLSPSSQRSPGFRFCQASRWPQWHSSTQTMLGHARALFKKMFFWSFGMDEIRLKKVFFLKFVSGRHPAASKNLKFVSGRHPAASKNLKFASGRHPAASKNLKPVLVDGGKRGTRLPPTWIWGF